MQRLRFLLVFILVILVKNVSADGLLMPTDHAYPKDFLRNRLTRVSVDIHGLIAETTVYQEFVNEWTQATDAVYSFPLPPDARATEFLYWRNDTTFKAILKVREQATNPGTGEGGIVARVNEYIGRNGIKIALKGIAPGTIQRVQLCYISLCDFYQGKSTYIYPLGTGEFVKYPLDHLQFSFDVETNSDITGFDIPTHPGYRTEQMDSKNMHIELVRPKTYIDRNLVFLYETDNQRMGVDFYSVANDTMDGHFALLVRPQNRAQPDSILPRRMIFLLGNSSRMFGYKLNQSISAISQALDLLTPEDYFNIIVFNYRLQKWQDSTILATSENIQSAKIFLSGITTQAGSGMDMALKEALSQVPDNARNNAIVIFTDGRSPVDPREIESLNEFKTGIFPIGIGNDLDRARLEMTADLNYGFVTYFDETDNLNIGMKQVISKLNAPVLQDVVFEYGRADLYDILPEKIPTTFAGSYFFTTGRYKNSGTSVFAMAGKSIGGLTAFNFHLDFSNDTQKYKFAEYLWAKEMIDALEREVEVYGETSELRQRLINLSLDYNIRCRYTAYVADYSNEFTKVDQYAGEDMVPVSYLMGNYPNPFNPTTTITFCLAMNEAKAKFIKIFNSLGQIVAVIDISTFEPGVHSITFNGRDFYGNPLPSGLYSLPGCKWMGR
ncbi:MAG: VWA domain-containing protein [Calditrichaeota bacterium]|nr:VWA domain-containing protein [Calditrichota bacterium]